MNRMPLLFSTLVFWLVGCTTTQFYSGPPLSFDQKAIVLTYYMGDGVITSVDGILIKNVSPDEKEKKVLLDKTKMEFLPGKYVIDFKSWSVSALLPAAMLGATLGPAGSNVYLYDGSNSRSNQIELTLEAGKIYIVRPAIKDDGSMFLNVTEY